MNPYGLRTDQLARYWTSGHGKTLKSKKDQRVAVCIDCHGEHDVQSAKHPDSKTHPINVPGTCAACHADDKLMADFNLPVEVVSEYQESVHGRLLLDQHDTGAPTCATCHGNHSAVPPGFTSVGAVCGQCHERVEEAFSKTAHAELEAFRGCVHCHGGGEGRHDHLIQPVVRSLDVLTRRYAELVAPQPDLPPERIAELLHPAPRQIMNRALPTCLDCHADGIQDPSLRKQWDLLDDIARVEHDFARTANRLDRVGEGVLLVAKQRFTFEQARTRMLELPSVHHSLDEKLLDEKIADVRQICDGVSAELTDLENGLRWRYRALIPMWIFAVLFAGALHVKYERLKKAYVQPVKTD